MIDPNLQNVTVQQAAGALSVTAAAFATFYYWLQRQIATRVGEVKAEHAKDIKELLGKVEALERRVFDLEHGAREAGEILVEGIASAEVNQIGKDYMRKALVKLH